MNYRFGFSLGKTEMDGQIYGAASAAADCFKALIPFFLFAAIRNRMWSQAAAAMVVWVVVVAYSMTSALGHAALNRLDTTGQRAVEAAVYKDLRADSKRAQEQLAWIPAHRPADTVAAEVNVLKAQRYWVVTKECTQPNGKQTRDYCQQFHKLNAELASGLQSQKLEVRIAEISGKLSHTAGGTVMAESDPQASVLAKLLGMDISTVQTALTVFVALLIEIGSGFGMYVAFAYWRLHDQKAEPARETAETAQTATAAKPAAYFEPAFVPNGATGRPDDRRGERSPPLPLDRKRRPRIHNKLFGLARSAAESGGPGREERARVTLSNGEQLQLDRRGDLGEANGGLLVFVAGSQRPEYVLWTDVERVDFHGPSR